MKNRTKPGRVTCKYSNKRIDVRDCLECIATMLASQLQRLLLYGASYPTSGRPINTK